MYYYIFEPPLEAKQYERIAQIKEHLSELGIAGEMTTPSSNRSVAELVELAVAKRYSTIVAVGTIAHINLVARAIEPYDVVLGILEPTATPDITTLVGASDWKAGAEQLKKRRWQPVRLGLINRSLCFITPASIAIPNNKAFTVRTPGFEMRGTGGFMAISPLRGDGEDMLSLEITYEHERSGLLGSLLNNKQKAPRGSRVVSTTLQIETEAGLPVVVAGSTICTTPILCELQGKALKLIVAKGSSQA
jgi:hypothetical protein